MIPWCCVVDSGGSVGIVRSASDCEASAAQSGAEMMPCTLVFAVNYEFLCSLATCELGLFSVRSTRRSCGPADVVADVVCHVGPIPSFEMSDESIA